MGRKLLGEILREQGKITPEQLREALDEQKSSNEILGHILFDMGAADERDLQEAWGVQLGREFVDLRQTLLSSELIEKFSPELARRHSALPVHDDGEVVTVALSNPLDVRALGEIARHLGRKVRSAIASAGDLEEAIDKYYG
jgi:type IV pilus assembly protein PilB